MSQIQSLQEKTYNYLSTVNAVVKNGKDIIYASTLARDIAKYQSEAAKYAVGDPKLLTIIAKTEYELISRSVDLMIYINNIALQGGEKNLMDNKQRIDLCIHVVNEPVSYTHLTNPEVKKGMKEALSQLQSSLEKVQRQEKGLKKGFF